MEPIACPFCGHDDIIRLDDPCPSNDDVWMRCEKCLACGPPSITDMGAIENWNKANEAIKAEVERLTKVIEEFTKETGAVVGGDGYTKVTGGVYDLYEFAQHEALKARGEV